MAVALGSVGVALVYVTTTTVIGFLSNLTSPLGVFRELGVVSAIGIVATLLVFGLLVPALKVELDELLERRGIDRLKPAIGTGSGPVNRLLGTGGNATKAPTSSSPSRSSSARRVRTERQISTLASSSRISSLRIPTTG